MKSKSFALFLIFALSLLPLNPAQAGSEINHPIYDSLLLMYTSDVILSGEAENEGASLLHHLSAPAREDIPTDLTDAKMASMLQALKDMRNELDGNCRLLIGQLKAEGKNCEADRVQNTCNEKRNEINAEIGILHNMRGDKRKGPTKIWHFIKRNGRSLWYKIGPVGRTFMRRLGPEALQIVASGGSLGGGVLKKLIKNVARSIGREQVKKAVYRGVERMLNGQLAILQSAGVDICDPDAEMTDEQTNDSNTAPDGSGPIPDGTYWECADVDGPVASLLESRKTMEGVRTNFYNFDHWMIYSSDPPTLHYFYSYDWSEDWDDGSGGWNTYTWSGGAEDTSVRVDENGVFMVPLTWNEARTTNGGPAVEFAESHSRWGLIPPDNYQTIYLCDWVRLEMPTSLDGLTSENFRAMCGDKYYFECFSTSK